MDRKNIIAITQDGLGMADGDTTPEKILDGINGIDLTTFATGGFATTMFVNQGADVIKVKRADVGDDSRYSFPRLLILTSTKAKINRLQKKVNHLTSGQSTTTKSIKFNLKSTEGLAVLYDLIEEADVVIENFRLGTAERLGIGYDDVRAVNDTIIYCLISAFGDSGPWSQRPGYDLLIQVISGMMNVTGPEDGDSVKVGLPQTDLITAMWAAFGILGALYRHELTCEGDRVELGMLNASLPWLTKQAGKAFVGEETKRMGTKDSVLAPYQS